jgi:hypothetical protein
MQMEFIFNMHDFFFNRLNLTLLQIFLHQL